MQVKQYEKKKLGIDLCIYMYFVLIVQAMHLLNTFSQMKYMYILPINNVAKMLDNVRSLNTNISLALNLSYSTCVQWIY